MRKSIGIVLTVLATAIAGYAGIFIYNFNYYNNFLCRSEFKNLPYEIVGGKPISVTGVTEFYLKYKTIAMRYVDDNQDERAVSLKINPVYDWLGRMDGFYVIKQQVQDSRVPSLLSDLHFFEINEFYKFASWKISNSVYMLQFDEVPEFCSIVSENAALSETGLNNQSIKRFHISDKSRDEPSSRQIPK